MTKLHEILYGLKSRSAQKYLDDMHEQAQKLEGLFDEAVETLPELDRILVLLDFSTPRCINAGIFALHLAQQFKMDLYVLHKGILGTLVIEQAQDLQVNVAFEHEVEILQLDEIERIVNEQRIDLIVTDGSIPIAQRLLTELITPILFTKDHPAYCLQHSDPSKS